MSAVVDFIQGFEGEQLRILSDLHRLLASELNLEPKMRFKIPFYFRHSWICYMNPTKKGTVELSFLRGNELSNEQGILLGKGRKQVMSIEITDLDSQPKKAIREIIHEAIILDDSVPYSLKKKKLL